MERNIRPSIARSVQIYVVPIVGQYAINNGWRNDSFRAYADHLESEEFATGLSELLDLCERARTTLMCAEAVWWRCHRRLIADVLCTRGIEVIHIFDIGHCVPHAIGPPARIVAGRLTYPSVDRK